MVDKYCLDDVPERVLDVLKTFLAASSRGEKAVLVLETQQKMVTTKYRSVETRPGSPVTCADTTKKRRKTPARAGPGSPSSDWKFLEGRSRKKITI